MNGAGTSRSTGWARRSISAFSWCSWSSSHHFPVTPSSPWPSPQRSHSLSISSCHEDLFSNAPGLARQPLTMTDYTGVDNLEVMRLASNYNHYLCDLVRRHDPGVGPVIDFGAGIGTFSGCICGDRSRVLCVEPDIALRASLEAAGYRTVQSVLDIPDESTAYAYSLNVLEHIADDAASIRELARRIRPGGRLLLYLPAFDLLYSSMDRKVGHYRRYTRRHVMKTSLAFSRRWHSSGPISSAAATSMPAHSCSTTAGCFPSAVCSAASLAGG